MIESIIKFILKKISGITADQWKMGIDFVKQAADTYPKGNGIAKEQINQLRREWVVEQFLKNGVIDGPARTIIQLAVAFLKFKGK